MNKNIEFLNYIYQNAEMGDNSISELLKIITDQTFKNSIESQLHEYQMILDKTTALLAKFNGDVKGLNAFAKISTYMMINIKTLTDQTPSHISEMLIQGSSMGITDITKKLHEYNDADQEIVNLATSLLHIEQQNIESLKKFL